MRGLMRAIAAALAAIRTVWTRCAETGAWVATRLFGLGGQAGGCDDDIGIPDEPPASLEHVRALAAAIASGSVRPEMLEKVDEQTFEWLSVLDRRMVAMILMASDHDLRDHMRGHRTIHGVVPCDEASVREYRAALERTSVQRDAEPEYGLAMA